ncbi:hypothetical protein BDP27DRAFT_1246108 [Rhodocollybia butyracea]|uniref:CxC2-like cysteine cluster KDZ transposase-associated domain-containing protein n=1 Tax=Rhodocollybia butyracea TaxID=206335 RepID=A0A9P5P5I2_9AGAR|nr:hypothetical protein BDP27DRAFT_1246108 [Rhodocollybia butyracea]
MEIDDTGVGFNLGEASDNDSSDTGTSRNIVVDLRDFIGVNKWHGRRKYKDTRTWKQRIQRFNDAWASIIDELVDEYIRWKYSPVHGPCSPNSWDFSIQVIDIYSPTRETTIYRDSETKATSALVQAGYLPASPEPPSIAVSLRTLELLHAIRLFKPNFSIEAFAKTVCHLHSKPYRRTYRTALSDTFDIYLAMLRKVDSRVARELGHDSPNYRALNSCPPCTYELEDEPPQIFSRMVAVDGNNSLKRLDGVGKREVSDTRVFGESDYYLSEEFVNLYADEVPARPRSKPAGEVTEEDFSQDWVDEEHGDPTDGDPDPTLQECTDNWKASDAEAAKKMWDAFRESGYFVMACRHGFVMWVADMIRSGELAKYPLSMVAKALKVFSPGWVLGYDIGCSFSGTIRRSSLGVEFKEKCCRTCVNAFHGYAHCALCQQMYHPLNIRGMGLEDLETLERLFSSSNQLASITRYMSPYRRRVFIDLFLQQWDREKYQNLATMLHNNYVQALDILEYELPSFEADIQALGLTKEELSTYIAEESCHYATLGSETEEDLHAVAYVELLQKYSEVNTAYENASTNFRLHTPSDYQFLSDAASYNVNLSEGRKTETRRRYLLEQRDKILFETVQLEAVMNIDRRWEPSDREYKDAVGYINTRKYRQALERLHKLVVQRLFELHKMNLSNTGTLYFFLKFRLLL